MKYNIIVADPPFDYGGSSCLATTSCFSNGKGKHYSTNKSKTFYDLKSYLDNVVEKDSLLFMWCSGATTKEAIDLMTAWGYEFKTTAFVWDKQVGVPGFYTYSSCEFVLVGKRGKIPRPYKQSGEHQFISKKKTKHSEKPEEVQDRIESMFPNHKYLELFARRHRPNWTCMGNELSGKDIREELKINNTLDEQSE